MEESQRMRDLGVLGMRGAPAEAEAWHLSVQQPRVNFRVPRVQPRRHLCSLEPERGLEGGGERKKGAGQRD